MKNSCKEKLYETQTGVYISREYNTSTRYYKKVEGKLKPIKKDIFEVEIQKNNKNKVIDNEISDIKETIDDETLSKLLEGHKLYIESGKIKGNCLSLKNLDLSGKDLSGLDLTDIDFRNSNLKGVNLKGSKLISAWLSGTDISNANLEGANFGNAEISYCNFQNSNLKNAILDYAFAPKAKFSRADLTNARFINASLNDVNFNNAVIEGANFSNADLRGAVSETNFKGANVEGAKFLKDMNKKYIFNLETTKIELYFDKSDFDKLTDSQKKELKSGFLWSRGRGCWVSRAKEPNLWRAKEVAEELGFKGEQREGKRLSYAEQVERNSSKAEARAERYEAYAINAVTRAESLQKPINDLHGDIAFFTQPNINSSSGRAFTNYRNKLFSRYDKGFEEYRKSDYFKDRAEAAHATASNKKFKDLGYLDRRIKECVKEIKARKNNIEHYEKYLTDIENGKTKKRYDGSIATKEELESDIERELELIEKAIDKQAFLENCVDSLGGIKFNKSNVDIGDIVYLRKFKETANEVIGRGPKNITYRVMTGGAKGMVLGASYAEIAKVIKRDEKEITKCKRKKSV